MTSEWEVIAQGWGARRRIARRQRELTVGSSQVIEHRGVAGCLSRGAVHELAHKIERIAFAAEVIVDTPQHHWATQSGGSRHNLFMTHPNGALDTSIQSARSVVFGDLTRKREAHEAALFVGLIPEIHPNERFRLEPPGGLFERFADDGHHKFLAALNVPSGLVEDHSRTDTLFDEEKLPVTFDDGGYGKVGSQGHL
jgi:hypothetical protein